MIKARHSLIAAIVLSIVVSSVVEAHPLLTERVNWPVVAGFERFYSAENDEARLAEGGLLLLSELNCVACHAAPEAWKERLSGRAKLSLLSVGDRLSKDDLQRFVSDPAHLKKGTIMPGLFADGKAEAAALDAIAQYLNSLRAAVKHHPEGDSARGRQLYHTIGCVDCHEPAKTEEYHPPEAPENAPVERPAQPSVPIILAEFYERDALVSFLLDPLAIRPAGRMPAAALNEQEAADIAAYLQMNQPPHAVSKNTAQSTDEGRKQFVKVRCNACHETGESPTVNPAAKSLETLQAGHGCLSAQKQGGIPSYGLSELQKRALTLALAQVKRAAPSSTVLEKVDAHLTRMNCYACHEWRGKGAAEKARSLYFTTTDAMAHSLGEIGLHPPKLDIVGRKLTESWLQKLFWGEGGGVRPHMTARMPKFGKENTEALIPLLQEACKREEPIKMDTSGLLKHHRAEAGRVLMGTGVGGLGCVSCHGLKDRKALGVQVINLTNTTQRIQPEYFKELLLNPQVTQPGTLMPPLFQGRKKANQEIETLWTYLKELDQNRLPEGLLQTGDYELKPGKDGRPVIFRSFIVGAGMQAIAVGFPQGVHVAFDALETRWALSWKGRFLDAQGTWEDRAMPPAKLLGENISSLPMRMPLAKLLSASDAWPETCGTAAGYVFKGYRVGKNGAPTFLYAVDTLTVEDTMQPSADGKTLHRKMTVRGSGDRWYFLGAAKDAKPSSVVWKEGVAVFEEVIATEQQP